MDYCGYHNFMVSLTLSKLKTLQTERYISKLHPALNIHTQAFLIPTTLFLPLEAYNQDLRIL